MWNRRWRKIAIAYAFLLPAMVGLIVFKLYPIIYSLIFSFFRIDYVHGGDYYFAGLANYIGLLKSAEFWNSFKVTVVFNLLVNPIQIFISLVIAILVVKNTLTNRIFRTLYLLPLGVSIAVASVVWGILFYPNGFINGVLNIFGIASQPFLTSGGQALWSIIIIASWCGVPFWTIFLLAGLQEIPKEFYEAAKVDGANWWHVFWEITLPLLKRVLLFVVVSDTAANFLLFVPIYALTNGGPQMSTNTLMYEAYTNAFVYTDIPQALTITSILLIILMFIVLAEFRFMRSED